MPMLTYEQSLNKLTLVVVTQCCVQCCMAQAIPQVDVGQAVAEVTSVRGINAVSVFVSAVVPVSLEAGGRAAIAFGRNR